MLEDAIANAAKSLSSTLLGSLLLLLIVAYILTIRVLRQDIREIQDELRRERDAHQKTREEQITDLRNLGNVTEAVNKMRDAIVEGYLGKQRP